MRMGRGRKAPRRPQGRRGWHVLFHAVSWTEGVGERLRGHSWALRGKPWAMWPEPALVMMVEMAGVLWCSWLGQSSRADRTGRRWTRGGERPAWKRWQRGKAALWYRRRVRLKLQALCSFDDVESKRLGCGLQSCISRLIKLVRVGKVVEVPEKIFELESSFLDGSWAEKVSMCTRWSCNTGLTHLAGPLSP